MSRTGGRPLPFFGMKKWDFLRSYPFYRPGKKPHTFGFPLGKALKGLRYTARDWRASRLPRGGTPAGNNPERVAQNPAIPRGCAALAGLIFKQIRIPGVAPMRRNPGLCTGTPLGFLILFTPQHLELRKKSCRQGFVLSRAGGRPLAFSGKKMVFTRSSKKRSRQKVTIFFRPALPLFFPLFLSSCERHPLTGMRKDQEGRKNATVRRGSAACGTG